MTMTLDNYLADPTSRFATVAMTDTNGLLRGQMVSVRSLAGIAKARDWLDELIAGRVLDVADLAQREKRSIRSTAMLLSLAFLAPALVQAIADNRFPRGIGLTRLADLPSDRPSSSRRSACTRQGKGGHPNRPSSRRPNRPFKSCGG